MATSLTPLMLAGAAHKARDVGAGIGGQLANLRTTIETQVGVSLRGGAGTSLTAVSVQLDEQLRRLLSALNTMADNVDATRRDLGATDAESARAINQVLGQTSPLTAAVIRSLG
ncbi:hypothetical protein [Frankia sp. QA3]|uniref:hypothetical protein n=1 Tax=Frankia sp. QA3 TaxID=710111 RepID=UPI000269BBF9|nr:hypothetical protein [Frankia sp. QA3]EIV92648.1 hypothetical protein FraQA3DRAFT_2241 [Frankia sp. QA3]